MDRTAARPGLRGAAPRFSQSRRVRGLPELAATFGDDHVRLLLGIIVGISLTAGGAYIADATAGTEAKPMVNWEVVTKNVDAVIALARAGWKRIAG
jgi:hypothetical protein